MTDPHDIAPTVLRHHSERQAVADRHRAAVVTVEMRRLERQLLAVGPMPRAKLAESTGARRWREGSFDRRSGGDPGPPVG